MADKITPDKLKKYFSVTARALGEIRKNVVSGKEKEAREILAMAENYVQDAKHFEHQDEIVDAFAALNYAHGWIDCGVRLGVFDVHDDKLFTVV